MKKLVFGVCLAVLVMFSFSTSAFSYIDYQFYHMAYRDFNGGGTNCLRFGFTIKNDDGTWPDGDDFIIEYVGANGMTRQQSIGTWGPYVESSSGDGSNPDWRESKYFKTNIYLPALYDDNGVQMRDFTVNLYDSDWNHIDNLNMHVPDFDNIPDYAGFDMDTLNWSAEGDGYRFNWDEITGSPDSTYRFAMMAEDETGTYYNILRKLTGNETSVFITNALLGDLVWDVHFEERMQNESATADNFNWVRSYSDSRQFSSVPIPGAVWLLGSCMVGLLGLRKRRS